MWDVFPFSRRHSPYDRAPPVQCIRGRWRSTKPASVVALNSSTEKSLFGRTYGARLSSREITWVVVSPGSQGSTGPPFIHIRKDPARSGMTRTPRGMRTSGAIAMIRFSTNVKVVANEVPEGATCPVEHEGEHRHFSSSGHICRDSVRISRSALCKVLLPWIIRNTSDGAWQFFMGPF